MSKPWPKATIESERPVRQRSDTKALFRLGDKLVEAHEMEALRRESGTHPVPRESGSAPAIVVGAEPAPQKVDVLLWFDEIEEPVRAHAELAGARLRVRAPLSLLRIGSQLQYTVIASGAVGAARVDRVAFAAEPGAAAPLLEVDLLGDAPPVAPMAFDKLDVTEPGGYKPGEQDTEPHAALPEASPAAAPEPPGRAPRWLGLLCAGALGVAGGAAAMKRWTDHEYAQRLSAERERAAREIEAARAAAEPTPVAFRVVPDELPAARATVPPPSLLNYEVLPALDALPAAPVPAAEAAPPTPTQGAATPAVDEDRLPRVTIENQRTTIIIPMRGSGDGMESYPLSTPGVLLTLPKAFALIPPGNHEPARGLARRIGLRKVGSGTQVKILYRSMAVRPHIAYDPAVGVAITLQRTW